MFDFSQKETNPNTLPRAIFSCTIYFDIKIVTPTKIIDL